MAKNTDNFEEVQAVIDNAISPDKMSQQDAIDFLDEIEEYCRALRIGIENDIANEAEEDNETV